MWGALLAFGHISSTSLSIPFVTGSSPAKTLRKGFSQFLKIFLAFFIFYLIACSSEQANSNSALITPLAPLPPATPLPAKSPLPAITPLPALQPIPASTYLPTDTQIPTSTPLPIATPISQYDSVIFPEDYSDDPNNPTDLGYIESDLYILNEFGDNN